MYSLLAESALKAFLFWNYTQRFFVKQIRGNGFGLIRPWPRRAYLRDQLRFFVDDGTDIVVHGRYDACVLLAGRALQAKAV